MSTPERPPADILSLRERAGLSNAWLAERFETLLPPLMARSGIDLWIVDAREYAEDPVIMTLLPEPMMSAGRRMILVFARRADGTVERLALSRYGAGGLYRSVWEPSVEEQDACLRRVVAERNPKRIGLDYSSTFAHADGLTRTLHERLLAALGPELSARVVSAEALCVGWLERRSASELAAYPGIAALGHRIIEEAFSPQVVRPGTTTVEDLAWWIRQRILDLGLAAWFHPIVDLQGAGLGPVGVAAARDGAPAGSRSVILPGDLIHCDIGFYYLALAVDQQQNAYVLEPGQKKPPEGLVRLLHAANRAQDILAAEMATGRTGNEILAAALDRCRAEKIPASIYTHPLGYHGHAAGPTIGLWDNQERVPGAGDYPLFEDTCYAIELNVTAPVSGFDASAGVRMAIEEDAAFTQDGLRWLSGRQKRLHLISYP